MCSDKLSFGLSANEGRRKVEEGEVPHAKRHLFAFPAEQSLRGRWVHAIGRQGDSLDLDYSAVYDQHFTSHDFEEDISPRTSMLRQRCRLKCGAVPWNSWTVENFWCHPR